MGEAAKTQRAAVPQTLAVVERATRVDIVPLKKGHPQNTPSIASASSFEAKSQVTRSVVYSLIHVIMFILIQRCNSHA
jgi:hypothetical protein